MKRLLVFVFFLFVFVGCEEQDQDLNSTLDGKPSHPPQLTFHQSSTTLANEFCAHQKTLKIVSTGLRSVFSIKGNKPHQNYCGGELILSEDGMNFEIDADNYCYTFSDQEFTITGKIAGAIESGSNFTSTIPLLSILGDDLDIEINGDTWDGRADDMFVT